VQIPSEFSFKIGNKQFSTFSHLRRCYIVVEMLKSKHSHLIPAVCSEGINIILSLQRVFETICWRPRIILRASEKVFSWSGHVIVRLRTAMSCSCCRTAAVFCLKCRFGFSLYERSYYLLENFVGRADDWGTAPKDWGSVFDSRWNLWKLSIDLILSAYSRPEVGPLSLWQKWVPRNFFGVKSAAGVSYSGISCAECQSKDGSRIFHPPSESLRLLRTNFTFDWISWLLTSTFLCFCVQ
jgi:hypothetical protein